MSNNGSYSVSYHAVDRTTGELTAKGAVSTGTWTSTVAVDPSGRFAYAAINGADTIVVYFIDQTTGALTAVSSAPAGSNPLFVTITGAIQ